jgi:hypothetical protein
VLPDPVPREAESSLAWFEVHCTALVGEGAVPVFTAGGKVLLAGLLLALPALAAPIKQRFQAVQFAALPLAIHSNELVVAAHRKVCASMAEQVDHRADLEEIRPNEPGQRWFGLLTDKPIRRGIQHLRAGPGRGHQGLDRHLERQPRPFTWTKTAG